MDNVFAFRRKVGFPLPHGGMAGHVAWGFALPNGAGVYCGSTENLNSQPWHPVGGNNGFWASEVRMKAEMISEMRKHGYTDYKTHNLKISDAGLARRVADNCKEVGYSFVGNNCVDHVYQILTHYGALDLPLPLDAPYPNGWFSAISWTWHPLDEY